MLLWLEKVNILKLLIIISHSIIITIENWSWCSNFEAHQTKNLLETFKVGRIFFYQTTAVILSYIKKNNILGTFIVVTSICKLVVLHVKDKKSTLSTIFNSFKGREQLLISKMFLWEHHLLNFSHIFDVLKHSSTKFY